MSEGGVFVRLRGVEREINGRGEVCRDAEQAGRAIDSTTHCA